MIAETPVDSLRHSQIVVGYGVVPYVLLYQHFVKQEAGPATIVRRHARPGPCSHLMRGHDLGVSCFFLD